MKLEEPKTDCFSYQIKKTPVTANRTQTTTRCIGLQTRTCKDCKFYKSKSEITQAQIEGDIEIYVKGHSDEF